jgi:ABC-2 family transporter
MKKLLLMNLKPYAVNLLAVASLMTALALFVVHGAPPLLVILGGLTIMFAVLGAVFVREQYEEKHGGYAFLMTLPLRPVEIVAAKFFPALLGTFVLTGFMTVLLTGAAEGNDAVLLIRGYLVMMGCGVLVLASVMYLGIFLIGYTKFLVAVLVFTTLLGLGPMILMHAFEGKMDVLVDGILAGLKATEFFPTLTVTLLISTFFFGCCVWVLSLRKLP